MTEPGWIEPDWIDPDWIDQGIEEVLPALVLEARQEQDKPLDAVAVQNKPLDAVAFQASVSLLAVQK